MMEWDFSNSLQAKVSKIESAFLDLNNELLVACTFLQCIKDHSLQIVEKLKCTRSPRLYLQEFVKVNSVLLKYQMLLMDINCKFELSRISENYSSFKTGEDNHLETCGTSDIGNANSVNRDYGESSMEGNNIEKSIQFFPDNEEHDSFAKDQSPAQNVIEANANSKHLLPGDSKLENNIIELPRIQDDIETMAFNIDNFDCAKEEVQIKISLLDDDSMHESREKLTVDLEACVNQPKNVSKAGCKNLKKIKKSSANCNASFDKIEDKLNPESNYCIQKPDYKSKFSIVHPADSTIPSDCSPIVRAKINNENSNVSETKKTLIRSQRNLPFIKQKIKQEKTNDSSSVLNFHPKLGEEFEVSVEHVQSPAEFYVYFSHTDFSLLTELKVKLKSIPEPVGVAKGNNSSVEKKLLSEKIGSHAVYYSICDEVWYRAEVTDWCLEFDDELVFIFVIDTGETKCVPAGYLQPIPEDIKRYPVFLQRCHLSGICSINTNESSEIFNWLKNSTEQMRCWIEISKSVKIEITSDGDGNVHPATSLPVTLWVLEEKENNWFCINQLLIAASLAKANNDAESSNIQNVERNCSASADNQELEKWNPMKEDSESPYNTYDLNTNNPAAFICGYMGKDYQRVCLQYANSGKCYKGKSCRKEHKILNPLGYTTDKESVYKSAFNSLPTPLVGEMYKIKITSFLQINNFYCNIKNPKSGVIDEETLSSLIKFMNSKTNICQMKKLIVPPAIGQIVIGKYSTDNAWYRAKVLESEPENNLCTVLFVDYGYKETLPLSSIRAIEPRYLHLPFQAVQCIISKIKKNPKSPHEEETKYLNQLLKEKNFTIKVRSVFPGEEICLLVYLYDEMGNNIEEELLLKNYAVPKEEIIMDHDSQVLPG